MSDSDRAAASMTDVEGYLTEKIGCASITANIGRHKERDVRCAYFIAQWDENSTMPAWRSEAGTDLKDGQDYLPIEDIDAVAAYFIERYAEAQARGGRARWELH